MIINPWTGSKLQLSEENDDNSAQEGKFPSQFRLVFHLPLHFLKPGLLKNDKYQHVGKLVIGLRFKKCTHSLFWGWPNLCLSLVVDGSTFFVRFFNPTSFFFLQKLSYVLYCF